MSAVRRIIPLVVGWERLPRAWSIHGDETGTILVEPVPVVLLDTDLGWVLIDTGMNTALIRDRPLYERLHGRNHAIVPILPDRAGEPLEHALAAAGVELGDISTIVLSHLHNDHAGGLRLFAPGIPVYVQRRELEYALSDHPIPERNGMFRIDYDDPEIAWRRIDGDSEILPGLRAVLTPGHTPGHQSFVVELQGGGGYVLAFDAGDLTANFEHELPVGGFIGCTAQETLAPIRRLNAIAAQTGFQLVPGHDPAVWPALMARLAPAAAVLPMPSEEVAV